MCSSKNIEPSDFDKLNSIVLNMDWDMAGEDISFGVSASNHKITFGGNREMLSFKFDENYMISDIFVSPNEVHCIETDDYDKYKCSRCMALIPANKDYKINYCPKCGAKFSGIKICKKNQ